MRPTLLHFRSPHLPKVEFNQPQVFIYQINNSDHQRRSRS